MLGHLLLPPELSRLKTKASADDSSDTPRRLAASNNVADQAGIDLGLVGECREGYAPPDTSDEDFLPSFGRQDHA